MKFAVNRFGNCRAYVAGDGGALEIREAAFVDGRPVYYNGQPIPLTGEIVELKGWPDARAIRVTDRLLIGLENEGGET